MRSHIVAVVFAFAAFGCREESNGGSSEADAGSSTSGTTSASGTTETVTTGPLADVPAAEPTYRVEYDVGTLTLSLWRDDQRLLAFEADGLQWGVVEAIDDSLSYDPMYEMPVTYAAVTEAEIVAEDPLSVRLAYGGGGHAMLTVEETSEGRFAARWTPEADAQTVAVHRLVARTDPTEGFYGLGEVFDHPNHRGRDRAMQIEADLTSESSTNEVHAPIPFLVGTMGWGLFVEDPHPGRFEVATDADDRVQATFGTGIHSPDGITFHLFGAAHPLDVTHHYHAVTGTPVRPAPWALGPWVWRNENIDQAQVLDDAATLRDLDLATSAIWIDRPYATGVNTFDFAADRYPDPQAMIDTLHDQGLRVALWHTPYVSDGDEPAPELNAEAEASGYFPPEVGLVFNPWGTPIDLTNPDAFDWWQALIGRYTDMGIEGFKLDYAEDVVAGLAGGRVPWEFADGSDDRTMHALYQLFYHRAYAETLPSNGGFLLCRAATYGDQTNVSVIWPGDLDADMSLHRSDKGGEKAVGGLPAAVVAGSSLGPSGFPLFASDTGGYIDSPPSKETMTRWFQHTALTPVMQIGTASSDVAWEFDAENGFDDEMLGWYREFTRLHLRLFPYLWTYVVRVADDGRAIQRPVGLAHPELGLHPAYDYLLGDHLLVAPVVEPGQTEREVVFPAGTWVDWFDGTIYEGGTVITVPAPLSKLPLFLRAGGIVPRLRPTIDTLSPTASPATIDSFDTSAGILYPRLVAGPDSMFELYDGTRIAQGEAGNVVSIDWTSGETFVEGGIVEFIAFGAAPAVVRLDGVEVSAVTAASLPTLDAGWVHDPQTGGTLQIRIPAGDHRVEIDRG